MILPVALVMPFSTAMAQADMGPRIRAHLAEAIRAYDGGHLETAWSAWQAAARAGSPEAMTALADLYDRGEGLEPSAQHAAMWYRRAAMRGDAIGQLNLGEMHLFGRGVRRDIREALFWLILAADNGNDWAKRKSREVGGSISSADRRAVHDRIRAWQPISGPLR